MKYILILVVLLSLYTTASSSLYPGIEACAKECEDKSQEICEKDGEACEISVLKINECITAKCEDIEELEDQEKCTSFCVEEFGHKGVVLYNSCVDACIDNGDKDEVAALQKQQLKADPEYIELLQQWKSMISDGEVDGEYIQNFLNSYEGGMLKELLPTKEELEQDEEVSKLNLSEEQIETLKSQMDQRQKKDDL